MRTKIALLALLLWVSPAWAIQGVAPYAIFHPKWRCDEMIAEYSKFPEFGAAVLLDTFGNDTRCFDRLVRMPNLKVVEIHVINETCFPDRGRHCQKAEVPYGYSIRTWKEAIRKRDSRLVGRIQGAAARAAAIAKRVPANKALTISPLLESNLGVEEGRIVFSLFRPYFKDRPETRFAWNPVRDVGKIEGTSYELHGFAPRLSAPCVYNNDGSIFEPVQAPYYLGKYPQCDSFYWTLGDNGNDKRNGASDGFTDPPKRVGFNRAGQFREIVRNVSRRTGPAPRAAAAAIDLRGCREVRKVPDGPSRGFVWKQSDPAASGRSCGGKPSNGAVALIETGKSSRKLEAFRNGARVEQFCSAGDYAHDPKGRARKLWRSNRNTPDFPAGTVLKSDLNVCWVLEAPAERID